MRLTRDLRKEHLLACAIHVFAEHGLVAANHDLVAEAANVSVQAVFFYFPTRKALVDAVLSEVEVFFRAALAAANDPALPADETLIAIGRALIEAVDTHPDHAGILMEWSVTRSSESRSRFLGLYGFITRSLAEVIERGQREGAFAPDLDPADEAAVLHAAFNAFIQMKETGASAECLDRYRRSLVGSQGWMGRVSARH